MVEAIRQMPEACGRMYCLAVGHSSPNSRIVVRLWAVLLTRQRADALTVLLKGTRNLSTPLEVLMRGVAQEPTQALRFIAHSRRLPEALADYLGKRPRRPIV